MVIGAGQLGRGGEQGAVPLAEADAFQGKQRPLQQRAEFGQHAADPPGRADGDDHHRDLGVPAEERGPFAAAVRGAVHAEQCGGPVEAATVQQVADRDEGRHPADPFLAAQVDGQLGCLIHVLGRPARVGDLGQQPGSLQSDQPGAVELDGRWQNGFDAGPGIDRDRDERQVLGQGQGAVGAQVMLEAKAFGAAKQDAGRDLMPPVQLDQGVRGERAPAAVAFAEVAGQLQAVGRHRCAPSRWPSPAAAMPSARLATTLTAAVRC